jgi:hypothetical protein
MDLMRGAISGNQEAIIGNQEAEPHTHGPDEGGNQWQSLAIKRQSVAIKRRSPTRMDLHVPQAGDAHLLELV